MIRLLLVLAILATIKPSFAQETEETNSLRSGTITSQFDYIYRVSNNFQEYEVVKKSNLEQLKANVLDSIRSRNKELAELKSKIAVHNDSVASIKSRLDQEISEKEEAIADRDNFSFLGMGIQKTVYSSMMWLLVAILAAFLAFFSVQYFRSFGKIKKSQKDLLDLQEEFEQHRKNTLERERKLKRELIDAQMGRS